MKRKKVLKKLRKTTISNLNQLQQAGILGGMDSAQPPCPPPPGSNLGCNIDPAPFSYQNICADE